MANEGEMLTRDGNAIAIVGIEDPLMRSTEIPEVVVGESLDRAMAANPSANI